MLIQNQGFYLEGFDFPAFTLNHGEMVRFWVEAAPQSQTATNGSWVANKVIASMQTSLPGGEKIRLSPARVRRSFFDFIQPITLEGYLRSRLNLATPAIYERLSFFSLAPQWKLKDLGYAHQKIFAIICAFQRGSIVCYDYYGLAPESEAQLTNYVKAELGLGKSAVSFDDLSYKPENPDTERITNLDIRQRR
ncbi:hypothetical protein [Pontibacter actiniarum]|uniref:Uncharacterized protein n=1 Tax=Pontibacter actiniarum TaxID=323450 RepID=A0A1X9YQP5_9BACT|nr:hypothetical protein [Pontibacter actiniarum]ARS35171.1 hypothetical protein CA264_06785 [Pontibacter actiniarum]